MRALYWDGHELVFRSSYPAPSSRPKIEDGESRIVGTTGSRAETSDNQSAVVKVHLAGICSTDLQIFKGYMGFTGVPGHEFVGSVNEGPAELIGKRVVGEINFGCGQCDVCGRDLSRHCPKRKVMGILNANGAFAEYVSAPVANLHVVPESVPDEEAVFTEPLAAAFEILTQIELNPGDDVLVLGDGKLGNLCAQVLRLTGAKITALGKHAEKLALIKKVGVSLAPIVINEINVIGSRCGPFAPALEALANKQISVTPLIDRTYSLSDGIAAVTHAAKPGARKILLRSS